MPRKSNSVLDSLPAGSRRSRRVAAPKVGIESDRPAKPAGSSIDSDPAIAQRREELAAENRRLRAHPATLSMSNLIEFARFHPFGDRSAGTGLRRSKIVIYEEDDSAEAYTGEEISPYAPVT